jgi:adenine phosphoribosyltransferase
MIDRIKNIIVEVKDFPKPGIGFKDITPLIESPEAFNFVVDSLAGWARGKNPEVIAGIESRGFIFAAPVAHQLGLGIALIRKKGKLPRETICVKAPNEYSIEYFEMHNDSVKQNQRVVIIDDLIATGASTVSAIEIVEKIGGDVTGFAAVVELVFLDGVDFIKKHHPDVDIHTMIKFSD